MFDLDGLAQVTLQAYLCLDAEELQALVHGRRGKGPHPGAHR